MVTSIFYRSQRRESILRFGVVFSLLMCVLYLPGCAAYRFGTNGLYPPHIRTVCVPIFKSDSLRPGMGAWLTEAVAKKIEQNTNYKVVSREDADTVLEGTVLPITKAVSVTTINDDLREVDMTVALQVRWIDNHGGVVHPGASIPLPVAVADVGAEAAQVTEVGHSTLSAEQEAVEQVAAQIVAIMEAPW
jgi:hypothetical protein